MKGNQILKRDDLASQFEEWAATIRADRPLRAAGLSARIPKQVRVETEFESKDGHAELEIEISWPRGFLP